MKKLELTWHDVLDSYKHDAKWWWQIDNFLPVVIDLGYEYFAWNERIYRVIRYKVSYEDTGLTIHDIKETK